MYSKIFVARHVHKLYDIFFSFSLVLLKIRKSVDISLRTRLFSNKTHGTLFDRSCTGLRFSSTTLVFFGWERRRFLSARFFCCRHPHPQSEEFLFPNACITRHQPQNKYRKSVFGMYLVNILKFAVIDLCSSTTKLEEFFYTNFETWFSRNFINNTVHRPTITLIFEIAYLIDNLNYFCSI